MEKLKHNFGDDGLFWMSYDDLLKRFQLLDRTRLFDSAWTVVQSWASVPVAWVTGYLNTKFSVEIKRKGPTVFQLCQVRTDLQSRIPGTNSSSSMTDISVVSRESTRLICISSCKRKMPSVATTSFVPVALGLATAASRLRSTLGLASTK